MLALVDWEEEDADDQHDGAPDRNSTPRLVLFTIPTLQTATLGKVRHDVCLGCGRCRRWEGIAQEEPGPAFSAKPPSMAKEIRERKSARSNYFSGHHYEALREYGGF